MILWITVLYHRDTGPRWLPCYLDLKTGQGQQMASVLAKTGSYWILFFALENPKSCERAITASIAPNQCQMLQEWANQGKTMPGGQPQMSKKLLKRELDKLKPKIVAKLEAGIAKVIADNS